MWINKISRGIPGIIVLLLAVTLFRELTFSAIVPIWHTPDEQAHFAQTAYFAQLNHMYSGGFDLNKEILMSERLLGTERDNQGNNKFTFHPEYKIEYTDTVVGKYENVIANLPKSYRTIFVKQEAANYPPLYYWLTGFAYKLFYNADLIGRVYAGRFVSIILSVLTVFFAWLIGRKLFPKDGLLQITLPMMVSFQPMFSFVGAGVTSDNLLNLLFTVMIYLSLLLIEKGPKLKLLLSILGVFILMYLTKPQFVLSIPVVGLAFIGWFAFSTKMAKKIKWLIAGLTMASLAIVAYLLVYTQLHLAVERFYPQSFFPGSKKIEEISFYHFFRQTISQTVSEAIPWYWGAFDWLGVTFPREIHRVLNRLIVLAALGIIIKLAMMVKKRTREDWMLVFMIATAGIYFMGITYYNYLFTITHGYPFGIQGRYYFPVIVPQMALLLSGLTFLVPGSFAKVKRVWTAAIGIGMIVLNFVALWIIAETYYDLSSLNTFIIQASQYKPWFFKGDWLIFWLVAYLITLIWFLITFGRRSSVRPSGKRFL